MVGVVRRTSEGRHMESYYRKTSQSNHWDYQYTSIMPQKLNHAKQTTQDRLVMVKESDRIWSLH